MYQMNILDSITRLPKDEWDEIAGDNIYASYGWLKTVEDTFIGRVKPNYFVVHNNNQIVGSAICYLYKRSDNVLNLDHTMLGRFKQYASKLNISFLPALICNPLESYGDHFLIHKSVDQKQRSIIDNILIDGLENKAFSHKIPLVFVNVMDHEYELNYLLKARGYNKTFDYNVAYLDIEWSSFGAYLDHLKRISKKTAKSVRNEVNRNRNKGVLIKEIVDPSKYESRFYDLLSQNYRKYNLMPFPFKQNFFKDIKSNLGSESMIYVSFKKDELTGVCIAFKRRKVGYILAVSVDHEMAGNDFTYFNLGYYRHIIDAMSNRLKRLYFGPTQNLTKERRGCKFANAYVYYRSNGTMKNFALRPWFALHSLWNQKYKSTTATHSGIRYT